MKREMPFASMQRLLRGYGVTAVRLSEILDVSYNTAAARCRDPGRLTLHELQRISTGAGIPIEELRSAIKR